MQLQLTITLGELLQAATVVVSAVAVYTGIMNRIAILETKLAPMWDDWLKRGQK